jgi:predicted MFS family arabinose efflux permease
MLILLVMLVVLVTIPLTGGRLRQLAHLRLQGVWLLPSALALQVLVISVVPTWPRPMLALAHLLTYVAAGGFLWLNRRVPGIPLAALGGGLNLIAISLNGGTLPASAEALARAGIHPAPNEFVNSGVVHHPRLALLGDIFSTPESWPAHNVFSIGDILIALGLAYGIHRLCGSVLWRSVGLIAPGLGWAGHGAPRAGLSPDPSVVSTASSAAPPSRPGLPGTRTKRDTFRGALAVPDVRALWISQALSEVGDWAARIALAVLVLQRTGSPSLVAAVTAASLIPYVVSPLLATWCNRFNRRTVLIALDLARFALFAALLLPMPTPLLLLTVLLAAIPTPAYEAVRAATLVEVCPPNNLNDALTLSQLTSQSALIFGAVLSGSLLAFTGPATALVINAATFLLSAVFLFHLRRSRATPQPDSPTPRHWHGIRDALGDPLLRRAVALTLISAPCTIVPEALATVYARHINSLDSIGLLAAAAPLAAVIAGLLIPRHRPPGQLLAIAAAYTLTGSIGAATLFLIGHQFWSGLASYLLLGIALAASIPTYIVFMRQVPDTARVPLLSIVQSCLMGGQAIAAIIGGILAERLGIHLAIVICLFPVIAFATVLLITDATKWRSVDVPVSFLKGPVKTTV